jgi:hypothetical protein
MIMRLYNWYVAQPKQVEPKPIREQFETVVNAIEKEIKKRGRKPKANG